MHLMTFYSLNSMPGRCAQSVSASFLSLASCGLEKQAILVAMATGWLGCDRAAFEVIHCLRKTEEVDKKQWPARRGHGGWRRLASQGDAKHSGGMDVGHPTQEGCLGLCKMSPMQILMQISFSLPMVCVRAAPNPWRCFKKLLVRAGALL